MSIRNGAVALLVAALIAMTGRAAEPLRKNAHALLIGVTFYENLAKSKHLEGPANDVELMYRILTETFHFDPARIRKLSENDGKGSKDFLPTRANIKREFERLAKEVKEGDEVFIHLSGLGSQQPERAAAPDPEPDGLDKIFLPRDIGKWDAAKGTVTNAILDDEIVDWVKAIRNRKASVCLIFDSCHSGTAVRGGKEQTRLIDMVQDLGIPVATILAAGRAARAAGAPKPPFKLGKQASIVVIGAAQPTELTVERTMPPRLGEGKMHGLLSYAVARGLLEASEASSEPITYSDLARRIQTRYIDWGRTFPMVLNDGGDSERTVFGDKVWPGRLAIELGGKAGALTINAGTLHGLTPNSILTVAPPAGKGKDLLGYVKVKEVRPFDCDVQPCDQDGKLAKTKFPAAATCEKHLIAHEHRLRIAIDPIDEKGRRMTAALQKAARERLAEIAKDSEFIELVDRLERADWLVRPSSKADDKFELVPAAGWSSERSARDLPRFGPLAADDRNLPDTLDALQRVESLLRIAAEASRNKGLAVKVELVHYKGRTKDDLKAPMPVPWSGAEVPLHVGDLFALRLSNSGKAPIDVTALYVSSKYSIQCVYPNRGEINRLLPGDSVIIPDPSSRPGFLQVNAKSIEREQIVIFALKASKQPVDFHGLEQPDLEGVWKRLAPPRVRLLGGARDEIDDYTAIIVPLVTRPEKRP